MNKADYIKQRIDTIQLVESYGVKLKKSGKGFKGLCPFHDDHEPSFLIYPDTQRWKCFGCNEAGDIFGFVMKKEGVDFPKAFNILARKVGIDLREDKKIRGGSSLSPKKARAHLHTSEECNLDNYARKKRLPIEFLKQIGLQDIYYFDKSAIRIPYSGIDNQLVSIHIRVALEKSKEGDNRFRWRRGDKTCPYGLWRLNEARQKGYVVLAEGDSDCHTLWYHREPAFGIPGASTWNDEWSEYLEGIP
ncbi:MAG: CHC2 zinc finger domain-containing protein, partial [Candidatus Hodarchaeota archaeon]